MLIPRLGAIAVVIHQDRVLLVKRKKEPDAGLWGFPGGHVEPGETALAAAARELMEETGVVASPLRYLTNVDVITHGATGALQHHFLLAAVLCHYQSGKPCPADDAEDARWFALSDLSGIPTSVNVADIAYLGHAQSN